MVSATCTPTLQKMPSSISRPDQHREMIGQIMIRDKKSKKPSLREKIKYKKIKTDVEESVFLFLGKTCGEVLKVLIFFRPLEIFNWMLKYFTKADEKTNSLPLLFKNFT